MGKDFEGFYDEYYVKIGSGICLDVFFEKKLFVIFGSKLGEIHSSFVGDGSPSKSLPCVVIKKDQTLFLNKIFNYEFFVPILFLRKPKTHRKCLGTLSCHLNHYQRDYASIFDFAYLFKISIFQWLVF